MAYRDLLTGTAGADRITGGAGPNLIYGYAPDAPDMAVASIAATRVAAGLSQPVFAASPPGDPSRLFIVERNGLIKILDQETGAVRAEPFLDVSQQISTGGERGLLGLAFHPDYATNGTVYVNLTNPLGDTEIRAYTASAADPNRADPAGATLVLAIDQPEGAANHKAGWLGFGPDGDLYAALGDGGVAANAQNVDSLLGKILRLDVNADAFPADPARNYAIPADNPFAAGPGADEVWALGLRNPWRPAFDRGTGELYIADVGQDRWEEVDIGQAGANYGWPAFEGFAAGQPAATSGTPTPPVFTYGHDVGQSITGGTVYRGPAEAMQGQYVFGDFVSGRIWTLQPAGAGWTATERTPQIQTDAGSIDNISSFGEDAAGNLYVVDFDGEVFRLTPRGAAAAPGGGDAADDLQAGDGDDMVFAGSGNDTVQGGAGNDVVFGGAGDDIIHGDDPPATAPAAMAADYMLG